MRLKYFPHSWFQIKTDDLVIYFDPAWVQSYFDNYPKKVIFSHYPDSMDGLPEPDLEKADLILVTHHHKDHQKRVTVDRLRKKNTLVAATQKCTVDLGDDIKVVKPGDTFLFKNASVKAVDAYNTPEGSSTQKQHKKGECNGYLLTIDGKTIYHAGDTDVIPEMKTFGSIDVALFPIGGKFTMNIDEAVEAVQMIKPKIAIPMHFLEADPKEFAKKMKNNKVTKTVVLDNGNIFEL